MSDQCASVDALSSVAMSKAVHISKKADGGWAVKRHGAGRSTSVHRTQSEAAAGGRRLALKSGGAELVIHRADGRIRDRDTVGAAKIDAVKQGGAKVQPGAARKAPATSRAPRMEGARTTLR